MRRESRGADSLDRGGSRRLGADGQEVREDGGPVARSAEEEGAGERAARATQGDDRLLARRRLQELAQAAPYGREGICEAHQRARLRGLLFHRAALVDVHWKVTQMVLGQRARPQGRRRLPAAEPAARRDPGRLQGPWGDHEGQVPDCHVPALQRGAHPGLLGRDGQYVLERPRVIRRRRGSVTNQNGRCPGQGSHRSHPPALCDRLVFSEASYFGTMRFACMALKIS